MITLPICGGGEYTLDPRKIIAVGLNYLDHIHESPSFSQQEMVHPREPVFFAKTPNVLLGPNEPLLIPAYLYELGFDEVRVDHEAELAVIIGRECSRVSEADALDYVMGYSCFNDVTQRNMQRSDPAGWFRGKSLDGFGPIGPRIVPAALLPDPQKLSIMCRVNGELRQNGHTSAMIFPVSQLIAYISRHIRLLPGDIISTGTPRGISPLKDGDQVEVEIEKIGILMNPVVVEKQAP